MAKTTFVLDNGAYTSKAGFTIDDEPRIIPNCITKAKSERRRQFIGDQIDDCKDVSGLFYILPFQKGYLVNSDVQKTIWDYIFGRDVFNCKMSELDVIVTEPYFNFLSIQEVMNEIFFEDYQVDSLLRINSGTLSAYHYQKTHPEELCCLLVESGYSFTHIAPYCKGKKLKANNFHFYMKYLYKKMITNSFRSNFSAIRRIDVGGKLLTNHLKEITSYRQLHVMDETYVMNQVKEDICFVSNDFYSDMKQCKLKNNTIQRDYVLPDYTVIKRGYIKSPDKKLEGNEQIIRMNNERFSIPELLFHPSDVGIQQMGIAEAIVHAIKATPEEMHPHFYKNILLTGGNVFFPGFRDRVYQDVRALTFEDYQVNVVLPKNPMVYAWHGGVSLSSDKEVNRMMVTRQQYEEHGVSICQDKFDV
uniref:Actin-related protein 6 n=1 Tax=Strigamia maritima TaxID=126957 RepID=T1INQ6_STRMM